MPLLIEKPIAPTSAEADELVALARQKGLVLQVGHVERFNPALTAWRPTCAIRNTSKPRGPAATRFARPTSASCWT